MKKNNYLKISIFVIFLNFFGILFFFCLSCFNVSLRNCYIKNDNYENFVEAVTAMTSYYKIDENALLSFDKKNDLILNSNEEYLVTEKKLSTLIDTFTPNLNPLSTYNLEQIATEYGYTVTDNEQQIVLTREFATKRLILQTQNPNFNLCGAVQIASYEDLFVLQYDTAIEAYNAYQYYINSAEIDAVEIDRLCWNDEIQSSSNNTSLLAAEDNSSYISWGAEPMGVPEYSQYLNALVESNAEIKELPEVVVAVLDTGIDTDNPVFENRFLYDDNGKIIGKDYANDDYETEYPFEDIQSHGTKCAGIICDLTLPNVKILPIKFMSRMKNGKEISSTVSVYLAMNYLIEMKQKYNIVAVNMSFGSSATIFDGILGERIKKAYNSGILPITSAGNEAIDAINNSPANVECVITVSAIGYEELEFYFANYSNYGNVVDVCAPGDAVRCIAIGGTTTSYGTSIAAPHIAAYIALLKSDPVHKYSKTDIENILYGKYKGIETVIDLGDTGKDIYYGYGLPSLTNLMHDFLALEIVSDSHGSVSLLGENYLFYEKGDTVKLTFTPDNNCHVNGLYLDGKLLPYTRYIKEYEIVNLYGKHELRVEFATMYTVNHYLEPIYDLNDINTLPDFSEYELAKSEVYYSEFDVDTNAIPRDYEGFTVLDYDQKTITTNDTVVNIYYRRNIYNLTIQLPEEGLKNVQGEGKYLYGEKVTLKPIYDENHNTVTWEINECSDLDFVTNINLESQNQSFKMPASDITITAYAYYKEFDWLNLVVVCGIMISGVALIIILTRSKINSF